MRTDAADTHDICYEATPASVGMARTDAVRAARAAGAGEQQVERLRLAVSEAMSNAVIHAYGQDHGGGVVRLTATAIAGDLLVVVADDGCGLGHAPKSTGLGLGLGVITQLADGLTLRRRSSGGTQVEMRFAIADHRARAEGGRRSCDFAPAPKSLSSMTLPV